MKKNELFSGVLKQEPMSYLAKQLNVNYPLPEHEKKEPLT